MFDLFENNKKLALNIDFFILNHLFIALIDGRLDYQDISQISSDFYFNDIQIHSKDFLSRVYYLKGLGYIDFEPILPVDELIKRCEIIKIPYEKVLTKNGKSFLVNKNEYYKSIAYGSITKDGIAIYEDLKNKIKSSKGILGIFNNLKNRFDFLIQYKLAIVFSITIFCAILIFVFDFKISESISKMPILSSVIDTDLLKTFEDVNENDEYYKEASKEIGLKSSSLNNTSEKTFNLGNSSGNIDVKVQSVSFNEKKFKLVFPNGDIDYLNVKKDSNGKFIISIPQILKDRINRIKNKLN